MLRPTLIIVAAMAFSAPLAASAAPTEVHGEKTKPTKMSVTALKVKLEKARDAMQTLANQPAPSDLSSTQKKAYAGELTKLTALAEGTDVVVKDLDIKLKEAAPKFDALSEKGEEQSLRLQMALDRFAKMLATISNLLKKQSDTASGIIQNLK